MIHLQAFIHLFGDIIMRDGEEILKKLPILLNNANIVIDRNKSNDYITICTSKGILTVVEYSNNFLFKDDKYFCEDAYNRVKNIIKETI